MEHGTILAVADVAEDSAGVMHKGAPAHDIGQEPVREINVTVEVGERRTLATLLPPLLEDCQIGAASIRKSLKRLARPTGLEPVLPP
jgi:hypothetical protein